MFLASPNLSGNTSHPECHAVTPESVNIAFAIDSRASAGAAITKTVTLFELRLHSWNPADTPSSIVICPDGMPTSGPRFATIISSKITKESVKAKLMPQQNQIREQYLDQVDRRV